MIFSLGYSDTRWGYLEKRKDFFLRLTRNKWDVFGQR